MTGSCLRLQMEPTQFDYWVRSESNASYFIMLFQKVRGGCWWYDSRGWTFPLIVCKFCCRATDSSGALGQINAWHGNAYEAEAPLNSSISKKFYSLTFVDGCWTCPEIKQWMWAQWGGGWCVSVVATVIWETGHVLGSPAQLSAHEMKSSSISSSAQIGANHQLCLLHGDAD
jgi:hypothetical protein